MRLDERPAAAASTDEAYDALAALLRERRAVVLVGAGCSTGSGIPDYRGPDGKLRNRTPMQFKEFVGSPEGRARYWSRSAVGWPAFSAARPNAAHYALARLEDAGLLTGLITQNVDGLHHAAGSRDVVELHGSLGRVRCLDCSETYRRDDVQADLLSANPKWFERVRAAGAGEVESRPDGDAYLPTDDLADFAVPVCTVCGGVLKPDVVFFGENVPKEWVEAAWGLFDGAEVLLVVGSSLTVFSGRRFVYRAQKSGVPIAIVNQGPTRADDLADVKVEHELGTVLPRLAGELTGARAVR